MFAIIATVRENDYAAFSWIPYEILFSHAL